MMKIVYSEMDTPAGLSCRLEAAGHAGYAPAGQDIVCAGASTVMQGLVYLLAGKTILAGFFAAMAMSPFWCQCLLATVYHRESSPNNLDFSPDFLPLVHSFLFFLPGECVIML